jgi:hypothetical protein
LDPKDGALGAAILDNVLSSEDPKVWGLATICMLIGARQGRIRRAAYTPVRCMKGEGPKYISHTLEHWVAVGPSLSKHGGRESHKGSRNLKSGNAH